MTSGVPIGAGAAGAAGPPVAPGAPLPSEVAGWIGVRRYEEVGDVPVEAGAIRTGLGATENGNPLFWDDAVAETLTGGLVAPPTTLSWWYRPHPWAPGRAEPRLPLQVHFDLKDLLGLPEAVMTDDTIVLLRPLRPGDLVRTCQVLRSVSAVKRTGLGTGRFWVIDVEVAGPDGELAGIETYTGFGYRRDGEPPGARVGGRPARAGAAGPAGTIAAGAPGTGEAGPAGTGEAGPPGTGTETVPVRSEPATRAGGAGMPVVRAGGAGMPVPRVVLGDVVVGQRLPEVHHRVTATTVVLGALASRDWRPMHHDRDFAVGRNGTRDIFLNTPAQAAWLERLVTDWTGPHGRLGRIRFAMRASVFPGDAMVLSATVTATRRDEQGCGWVDLDLALSVDGEERTNGAATVAVPVDRADNPWARHGPAWQPVPAIGRHDGRP